MGTSYGNVGKALCLLYAETEWHFEPFLSFQLVVTKTIRFLGILLYILWAYSSIHCTDFPGFMAKELNC